MTPWNMPKNRAGKYFVYIIAIYCALLLISDVCATKLVTVGPNAGIFPLIMDGGALLFPLTYILDDIIAEIFGFKIARKTIILCFSIGLLGMLTFNLVAFAPTLMDSPDNIAVADAFGAVFGFYPRILCASFSAYLCGQLLNSWTLSKLKQKTGEKKALWLRLIGSTAVGQFADTLIFCTIAQWGVIASLGDFVEYTYVGYFWKVGVEIILLPVTYFVIRWLKQPVDDVSYQTLDTATQTPKTSDNI